MINRKMDNNIVICGAAENLIMLTLIIPIIKMVRISASMRVGVYTFFT